MGLSYQQPLLSLSKHTALDHTLPAHSNNDYQLLVQLSVSALDKVKKDLFSVIKASGTIYAVHRKHYMFIK